MQSTITYFEGMGREFTDQALEIASARAAALGIRDIILASSTGYTMERALQAFSGQDVRLIAVGGERGKVPGDTISRFEAAGHHVIFVDEVGGEWPETVVNAYRRLCEGMKVGTQVVAAAVDADLVAEGTPVIAIAGTGPTAFPEGGGADTALVMSALGSRRYGDEEEIPPKEERRAIHEILCKPL